MRARWLGAFTLLSLFSAGLLFGWAERHSVAQDKNGPNEKEVRQAVVDLVNAFNEGDAKKVAASFAVNAEYIDDDTTRIEGRAEIEKMYKKFFDENKGAKVQITLQGVRKITDTVALEDGEAVVTVVDKATQSTQGFALVMSKFDGKWLIASFREFPQTQNPVPPSERLASLDWLLGDWIDEGADSVVTFSTKWSKDKNYLLRDYTVKYKGKESLTGWQRIGVDPLTGQIKGWSFDSDSGNGETIWTKHGDEWIVKATGVTSDGDYASATHLIKIINKDRVQWKVMHRIVGDQLEPDSEMYLVRKPAIK
ncbi:SgcJ/EcaC family oxidoreductase [Telmatocola sphagniphila]|uniref:SgcJ/EcaC family oxidoreductase n=1 Tax=Telmatocola sphagniphila TaxID=1123043 RepID=A0A8E6B778_9BACT|nr:SgcJ/EcaC family oxidoreductase [Telmatocola sphagniphila]QVL31818.1 SgcJ/EcaC family oxidoreductase [Telmatocola sphagniphila]